MLDSLAQSLRGTLKKIANASNIDKDVIKDVVRDIQRALLQADLNVKLVLSITKEVERRALEEKPPAGMSSREHVIRIIYDQLVKILGEPRDVGLKKHVIMMIGLYGQGKTTTTAKMAKYFQKRGLKVGVIAADVHRPAAFDQLKQLGDRINVPVYGFPKAKDSVAVVKKGMEQYADFDIVIIDTSGRHSLEEDLIKEMEDIAKVAKPDERFLVIDAAVGQQAGPQAQAFHDAVKVTGVIITKLDGTAKAGGALSAVAVTNAPVTFIGTGEHIEDLEKLDPPRFISRLLGMGDLQTLLEKAQDSMGGKDAEAMAKKMMSGKFSLLEMRDQMEMLTKMGPLDKIMGMLPQGFGGGKGPMEMQDPREAQARLKKFKVIMNSMTKFELENPREIKSSRLKRIAKGAGVDQKEVRSLLKYYNMSQKAVKGFSSNRRIRRQLMKQLQIPDVDMG
ncbi:MAG: signal recognition particle protein Srp54 [Candidatus Thermoplasmatota archaeon]|nr:signal recognition particle protein Srp54 [Candidatus Thermoplasmatota archaeon]